MLKVIPEHQLVARDVVCRREGKADAVAVGNVVGVAEVGRGRGRGGWEAAIRGDAEGQGGVERRGRDVEWFGRVDGDEVVRGRGVGRAGGDAEVVGGMVCCHGGIEVGKM